MAIPTIIGMLVTTVYSLTDTFFIGLMENKSMTAAIGIVFSFVSFIQALGFWFGYGSGNAMSRKLGEKDNREAQILSSTGIGLSLMLGISMMAVLLFFVKPLAAFLGGDASNDLLFYSTAYLRIILVSMPFSLYGTTLYNQLRLCGNAKDGMIGLLVGMLSNMILDPIFIFAFKMGFTGAAWATLTGQILGCIILTFLSYRNGNIPVTLKYFNLSGGRLYHVLVGGLPNFSRQGITSIAAILLNMVAASYGEETIAALTVTGRIAALAYMVVIGWGQGFQPVCAMNYGAGKYDRVKKALRISITVGTAFLIFATVLLAIFAEPVCSLLTKNAEVLTPSVIILRLQCISLPLMGIYALSSMFTQNIGKYYSALVISIARQGIFYIPILFILPAVSALLGRSGIFGLYCVQPAADICATILGTVIMRWNLKHLTPISDQPLRLHHSL